MKLRDYQKRTIYQLYEWFRANPKGHPCIVLPTGSGKSHIVAELCKGALQSWPETRILMLTHVKELIEQDAEKMRQHWPGAPLGIYSAGMGRRDLSEPITFAGIQSVRDKSAAIGHVDIVIIDEAHTVSHRAEGGYRSLIADLELINPGLRVIGLTATPFRLGHGYITDEPALFDALIEPVSIEELVYKGFLCTLRSKVATERLDASGLRKRGGEYIGAEMQKAYDTADHNARVVDEVILHAGDRKSWLFFCAGVQHAENICAELINRGIAAACVTGKTPKKERDQILTAFKNGEIQALTNANVLTTGFDAPEIDLIAMLRSTMSPGLYMQMAGRGLRIADGKTDCLVLDFAGVVQQHGPITAVNQPKKKGEKAGDAPVKVCDHCHELVHISVMVCPACGAPFPEPEKKTMSLHHDDIMGLDAQEMTVRDWQWREHTSRASGLQMLKATYYGELSTKPVTEYLPILHDGYAGQKARRTLVEIADSAGETLPDGGALVELCDLLNSARHPAVIEYRMDGKFHRILNRSWEYAATEQAVCDRT